MDDACLAASPEETIKQSEKEGKKFKPTVSTCIFLSKINWHTTAKQLITMNTLRVNFVPHKKELKEGKNLKENV